MEKEKINGVKENTSNNKIKIEKNENVQKIQTSKESIIVEKESVKKEEKDNAGENIVLQPQQDVEEKVKTQENETEEITKDIENRVEEGAETIENEVAEMTETIEEGDEGAGENSENDALEKKGVIKNIKGKISSLYDLVITKLISVFQNFSKKAKEKKAKKQEENPNQEKKESKFKNFLAKTGIFLKKYVFTKNFFKIVVNILAIVITILCLVQLVVMGFNIVDKFSVIKQFLLKRDGLVIAAIVLYVIFLVVMIIQIINSIKELAKNDSHLNIETVSTLVGFNIVCLFMAKIFNKEIMYMVGVDFRYVYAIGILSIIYLFLLMFNRDIKSRILAIICSVLFAVIAIVVYGQGIGNFIVFNLSGREIAVQDLNFVEYVKAVLNYFSNDAPLLTAEALLVENSAICNLSEAFNGKALIVFLNGLIIFVSNIMPYLTLSLVGYAFVICASKNSEQYHHLKVCTNIVSSMIWMVVFALISFFIIKYAFGDYVEYISLSLSIGLLILTLVELIILTIITNLPWRIYNLANNRKIKNLNK